MGGVFFHEFDNLDTLSIILFPISIVVTLFGVAILAYNVGALYNNVLKKLHLKHDEILSPEMKAKERWQHHRGMATHSVWGGIAFLGTEYYRKQDNRIIEPHSVRRFKTRRRLDVLMEMEDLDESGKLNKLNRVNGAVIAENGSNGNKQLKEAQAEIEQLKAQLHEKEQRIQALEAELAAKNESKMEGLHEEDDAGLVESFKE